MSEKTRGRLYVAVCIACLLTCAALIASIFFGRPIRGQRPETHRPRMDQADQMQADQSEQDHQGQEGALGMDELLITEEYAAGLLTQLAPENLPLRDIRVGVSGAGLVAVGATADREKFKDYLESVGVDLGFRGAMFLALLPKETPLTAAFTCQGDQVGSLTLAPAALQINGTDLDLSLLPEGFCQSLSQMFNQALTQAGPGYSQIGFRDGAFVLRP